MFSIVIPIYNGVKYLEDSLTSVFEQTYKEWEVIIGINGHEPDSEIEKIANLIKEKLQNHYKLKNRIDIIYYSTKGKAATLNAMITHCKYNYIALLDVDDIWLPKKLEKQLAYIDNFDIVGSQCNYFHDMSGSPGIPTGNLKDFNFFSCNPIINCSAVLKKEFCTWCTDDQCFGVEDYDLWLRLKHENRTFYNIGEILCLHRIHRESFFNNSNQNYVDFVKHKWKNI